MTTTNSPGQNLKSTIKSEQNAEERQNKLEAVLKTYVENCEDPWRHPCVALMGELLGGNAHLAQDRLEEMKAIFLDILIILTDPEVFARLKNRGTSFDKIGEHFKQLVEFFDKALDISL